MFKKNNYKCLIGEINEILRRMIFITPEKGPKQFDDITQCTEPF